MAENRNLKSLKDEEQVRKRPQVVFGTNDLSGAYNGINEIFANSIDEAREGYGKALRIKIEPNNVITVDDDGRGLPMDWNEKEEKYNWELALCTLYSSGKYDSSQYKSSLGLNGLGLTATQYASEFMEVWSTYDGKTYYMGFKKGRPVTELTVLEPVRDGTGTKIRFKLDSEVFPALRTKEIALETYLTNLCRQAMLISGFEITVTSYSLKEPIKICYKDGIAEYIDRITDRRMLSKSAEFFDKDRGTDDANIDPEPYDVVMRCAFNFNKPASTDDDKIEFVEIYHNASLMSEGGVTVDGYEKAVTSAFTDYARSINKLNKNGRFLYRDVSSIIMCVATTDAPGYRTWPKNQTKYAITNPFIGKAFTQFIYNKLIFWFSKNQSQAEKIIQYAILNKTAREEGAEVSRKVINKLSKEVKFGSKPKNFRDCSSNITDKRELWITEGLSAQTSVKLACDPIFQAVMPIRGKIINCKKERITRILSSEIIIDLFRVFGCGMEIKTDKIEGLPKFDLSKLKWGKIIICADADVDGQHIICLVLTMIYTLAPSLIKEGKVYIAMTHLYEIQFEVNKESKYVFAYNDEEKDTILDTLHSNGIKDNKIKILRSKGLGENDPQKMWESTMDPDRRRLIKVEYPEDDNELEMYFDILLGNEIEMRRVVIDEYFDIAN